MPDLAYLQSFLLYKFKLPYPVVAILFTLSFRHLIYKKATHLASFITIIGNFNN